jgi:crotonobetainyl-CoA:carnitine CoA-transferase CaiB-like acyl-CoA transferase
LFKELCQKADVLCENFSVGAMARLGLAYDDIRQVNPRIIYASITAFGQEGPYARQRGYDMLSQAISGFMSINGFPENPPTRAGPSISDYYAGMLTAFSIVSALRYRDRTGKGQYIDIALLDSILMCLDNLGERYTVGGEVLTRAGNVSFGGSSSGVYPTTDGYVAVAAGTSDLVWRRFCKVIGRPELTTDPEYSTVPARRDRGRRHPCFGQRLNDLRLRASTGPRVDDRGNRTGPHRAPRTPARGAQRRDIRQGAGSLAGGISPLESRRCDLTAAPCFTKLRLTPRQFRRS